MDIKSGGTANKIGIQRNEYLNLANLCYANADTLTEYRKAIGFMDAFEFTLEPGSEAKKELMKAKETIINDRVEATRKWDQWQASLSYFEQNDVQRERDRIEIIAVGQRLEACWDISKRYGLFND
jgi:hypothetical protein